MQKTLHATQKLNDLVWHVTREVAIGCIFEMTNVASLVICNVHLAVIVNPQPTNNNVVNSRRHFTPRIMTTAPREQQMSNAWAIHHNKFDTILFHSQSIPKLK